MNALERNRVTVVGEAPTTLVFAHGFGCDQNMWRFLVPHYATRVRTITYDLTGSGRSDLASYCQKRHGTLHGHAEDLLDVLDATGTQNAIVVGHSVSAMIGLLAGIRAPDRITANVMLGPSPCYVNHDDYVGGFSRADIDSLLETLESNYLGWSSTMAPAIMGAPGHPEFAEELTNSFCRTDPAIAAHFARVTFLSDNRADLPKSTQPALVLQCSDDIIAPLDVGNYMARTLPNATLRVIANVGHCPHITAPSESICAMDDFFATLSQGRVDA